MDVVVQNLEGNKFSRAFPANKITTTNNNGKKNHNMKRPHNSYHLSIAMERSEENSILRHDQPASTRPLNIRKQSSEVNFAQNQDLKDNNPYKNSSKPRYPPRTSSIGMLHAPVAFTAASSQREDELTTPRSTVSQWTDERVSDTSSEGNHSTGSTISGIKELYIMSPSSEIMGNFVPVSQSRHASERSDAKFFAPLRATNLYEFEPDSPFVLNARPNTTFSNFIDPARKAMSDPKTPRPLHLKNARSESQNFAVQKAVSDKATPVKAIGYSMQRSESSPSITPGRFAERYPDQRRESSPNLIPNFVSRFPDPQVRAVSPDILQYQAGSEIIPTPSRRGRSPERSMQGFNKYEEISHSRDTLRKHNSGTFGIEPETRSPPRPNHRKVQQASDSGRQATRSPTKTLHDVTEHDESIIESPMPPFVTEMKQRSRSPMKKMFGENGWLGKTPNEAQEINHRSKRSPASKEKKSMMGRIKNKLGEMAERAELNNLSSHRSSRASTDRPPPKLSILSVSLSAPEQAKIYMELELMIVVSANTFLMNQFSQGRIAVDTIKKIVDIWKSRGRPVVIEFMYDQGTQRDLVALNQHNFRFYGERAGDTMRVNSMLYNWKSVASLMAIRTLCNADTVILKLLFDIEQILELIGAREPIMLRLQQIRSTANETMRLERLRRAGNSVPQNVIPGHDTWSSHGSMDGNGASRSYSIDDPYGGMKLVPDSYVE